jgi:hypothetical protein
MTREAQGMARAIGAVRAADGSFEGPRVVLRAVGIGGSRLKQTPRPEAGALVVVAGLGGGLDPALRTGDLVLDDAAGMLAQPTGGVLGAAYRGRIFTSPRILEHPRAKEMAWRETGAACVDMEQEVVQRWLGRTVVGLRVVLDTAMQVLDPKFGTVCDDLGNVKPWALLRYFVTTPSAIAPTMAIGRANAACMKKLGEAVRELVG